MNRVLRLRRMRVRHGHDGYERWATGVDYFTNGVSVGRAVADGTGLLARFAGCFRPADGTAEEGNKGELEMMILARLRLKPTNACSVAAR